MAEGLEGHDELLRRYAEVDEAEAALRHQALWAQVSAILLVLVVFAVLGAMDIAVTAHAGPWAVVAPLVVLALVGGSSVWSIVAYFRRRATLREMREEVDRLALSGPAAHSPRLGSTSSDGVGTPEV